MGSTGKDLGRNERRLAALRCFCSGPGQEGTGQTKIIEIGKDMDRTSGAIFAGHCEVRTREGGSDVEDGVWEDPYDLKRDMTACWAWGVDDRGSK